MNFTTQMEAARKGIVTDELREVSEKENISTEKLLNLVAHGKVIIPCNKNHKGISPNGIGSVLKTKINVNLELYLVVEDMGGTLKYWTIYF